MLASEKIAIVILCLWVGSIIGLAKAIAADLPIPRKPVAVHAQLKRASGPPPRYVAPTAPTASALDRPAGVP